MCSVEIDTVGRPNPVADDPSRFRALWTAASAGYLAAQVVKFALPVFTTRVTDSPLAIAGVSLALTAPWLLVGLLAGALVDRWDRRGILLGVNALRLAAVGALAVAGALGIASLPLLYACALVLGIGETFAVTTTTTMVPLVVSGERLDGANARLYGSQTVIEVVALPLGGALAAIGLTLTAAAGGLCYALALGAMLSLPGAYRPARGQRRHLLVEVGEGLRFLRDHTLLRTVTVMAAVINACWSAWGALLVLYAVDPGPLGLSEFGYGLLLTAGGVGGFLGTLCSGRIQRGFGRRWAIGINILTNAAMFGVTAFASHPWLAGAAIVIGDFGGPIWGIAVLSLQARVVPDGLRGRVGGAYRFVSFGAMTIGAALGGLAAELVGIRAVFAGCAILTALMLVPFVRTVSEAAMDDA